jgi:endonuclease YncB( thermonuclease family)
MGAITGGADSRSSRSASSPAAEDFIEGRASVVDGDTIEIHGNRIRFRGIDAPESAQLCKTAAGRASRCGAASAKALASYLAASSPVRCTVSGTDQYGRSVADCVRAHGGNVSAWLVRNGYALDWPRYSGGAYDQYQTAAKKERVGLWQGEFQNPWDWRAAQEQPALVVEDRKAKRKASPRLGIVSTGASCKIKGNISSGGKRIYHLPGQAYYDATRISERSGERWFCSEAEAQAAGWRRSKR